MFEIRELIYKVTTSFSPILISSFRTDTARFLFGLVSKLIYSITGSGVSALEESLHFMLFNRKARESILSD